MLDAESRVIGMSPSATYRIHLPLSSTIVKTTKNICLIRDRPGSLYMKFFIVENVTGLKFVWLRDRVLDLHVPDIPSVRG